MSPEQLAELVARYEDGETVSALGERFRVNRKTISEILKREGVRLRYRSIEPEEHAEVIRLYESRLSLAAVGEAFGVNAGTIRATLTQHNVPRRAVGTNQWTAAVAHEQAICYQRLVPVAAKAPKKGRDESRANRMATQVLIGIRALR